MCKITQRTQNENFLSGIQVPKAGADQWDHPPTGEVLLCALLSCFTKKNKNRIRIK